jgi:hypothetical protein
MKRILPIGVSDFEKVITGKYAYADKTLFIKELIEGKVETTLIPRPRRFGKTLNLSMLKYFFEKTDISKHHLFDGLAISNYPEIMANQGKYPVIFMTLKDVKHSSWKQCYQHLVTLIAELYKYHRSALRITDPDDQVRFDAVASEKASETWCHDALRFLSRCLSQTYQQKVVLLIDEYDTFIHEAYLNGYYDDAIGFARNFFSAGLKDNNYLQQSVITGILRVAKESIFSGLNSLEVCTFLGIHYTDKFGFLESEVLSLLSEYDRADQIDAVRTWYNGYESGKHHIYNPWSIITFLRQEGAFAPYWVNTGKSDLIKKLVIGDQKQLREDLDMLMTGKYIVKKVDEDIVFSRLDRDPNVIWSFLLFTGYLTFRQATIVPSDTSKKPALTETSSSPATPVLPVSTYQTVELYIPNTEIFSLFESVVGEWLRDTIDIKSQEQMLKHLVAGEIEPFKNFFSDFVRESLSVFDVSGKEPELFYHAFVLGMLISLRNTHEIKSNRESGYGRYDVMIIPRDNSKPGIIIEFKKVVPEYKETLKTAAHAALEQIANRDYATELRTRGIKQIIELAIVFAGKRVLVQQAKNS